MNIMLNNYCNMGCSYCFAKDVMDSQAANISDENMAKVIRFLKNSNYRSLRLLGGEPTLHPKFKEYARKAVKDDYFREVMIFTNGLRLGEDLIDATVSSKTRFLINFNGPSVIGEDRYAKVRENIVTLAKTCRRKNVNPGFAVHLGINIYKPDLDFQYVIDLAKELGLSWLRYAVAVPLDKELTLDYYQKFIPVVLAFLKEARLNNLNVNMDCNNIPKCLFTRDQLLEIVHYGSNACIKHMCDRPLDVDPDLNVIRCFPLSNIQVNIKDFKTVGEIDAYFRSHIDDKKFDIPAFKECIDCPYHQEKLCQGGCMIGRRHLFS